MRSARGATASATGARFVAARETLTVTHLRPARIAWRTPAPQIEETPTALRATRHWERPVPAVAVALPVAGAPPLGMFGGGSDEFDFADLAPGWVLAGYLWGYVQLPASSKVIRSGNVPEGYPDLNAKVQETSIDGEWRVEREARKLRVHWAATLRSVAQPPAPRFFYQAHAEYAIAFRVEGPRGTAPFSVSIPHPAPRAP